MTNAWSGVDTWSFRASSKAANKGLAPGRRTLTLRRRGTMFTLTADQVFNPDRNTTTIAEFVTGNCTAFDGLRLARNGPDIETPRLRFEPLP